MTGKISYSGALCFLLLVSALQVLLLGYLNKPAQVLPRVILWCIKLICFLLYLSTRLAFVGSFILPAFYPFMKRITYFPQAYLGMYLLCHSYLSSSTDPTLEGVCFGWTGAVAWRNVTDEDNIVMESLIIASTMWFVRDSFQSYHL